MTQYASDRTGDRPMPTNTNLPVLTALELETCVSVPRAASIKGVSEDTFKRHYRHLIRKLSPRRDGVKLRDLLASTVQATG
jgi:hypothetical protein